MQELSLIICLGKLLSIKGLRAAARRGKCKSLPFNNLPASRIFAIAEVGQVSLESFVPATRRAADVGVAALGTSPSVFLVRWVVFAAEFAAPAVGAFSWYRFFHMTTITQYSAWSRDI